MDTFIDTKDHQADQLWTRPFIDDIQFNSTFAFRGPADPTLVQWPSPNGGSAWRFALGNELMFAKEVTHTWKEGTNFRAHVHWTPHSRGVTEAGNVVAWKMDLEVIPVNSVSGGVTTYTCHATCPVQDHGHLIQGATVEVDLSAISGVSGWISGRVYRDNIGADTWVGTVANEPYLLQAGVHIDIDRPGSRWEYAK